MADSRSDDCGNDRPDAGQMAASGDASTKALATTVTTVASCGCTKHQGVHVQVTLLCPCAHSTTADAWTQTDEEAGEGDMERSRNKEYGASQTTKKNFFPRRSRFSVQVEFMELKKDLR